MAGNHGIPASGSTYVEYGPVRGNDIGTGTMFYQKVRSPTSKFKNFGAFGTALSDHYSNGIGLDNLSFQNWLA